MYRYRSNWKDVTGYRSDSPLSVDEIGHYAPSVLADNPHESRGDRYGFISTRQVLDGLREAGFLPFEVCQTRVRDVSRKEHTRHMIRMRHASDMQTVGRAEAPEIVLLNSHDGTSSYQLLAGLFRFVCSNGLIAGSVVEDIRIPHRGADVVNRVIEGSYEVLANLQDVAEHVDDYKRIPLTAAEQVAFANSAALLKWDGDSMPILPENLLRANRSADGANDLWTTFNRVQENLIRGGVRGRTATGRRTHTRAVAGVNENVRLNRALWTLTDQLARIKRGEEFEQAA